MKAILLLAIFAVAFAHEEHPVSHQMVNSIRELADTWTPMEPHENKFYDWTVEEIRAMLACNLVEEDGVEYDPSPEPVEGELPTSYDFRSTGCGHTVLDQGRCGSCWAFGASEAHADRLCKVGKDHGTLSAQHLVSCDTGNMGCNGGYLGRAWDYMCRSGTPTETCERYTSGTTGRSGTCHSSCDNGSQMVKYGCKTRVHPRSVSAIKKEIYDNGSVEGGFTVYSDFMNYRGGIYVHKTGSVQGGHAIKIMGWGTEGGVDYWLCQNSWGTSWGENGYFRIKMGQCGIEGQVYAASE